MAFRAKQVPKMSKAKDGRIVPLENAPTKDIELKIILKQCAGQIKLICKPDLKSRPSVFSLNFQIS